MVLVRKRRGGRRHKKLKAIDPFYSGPRKLLVDKFVKRKISIADWRLF
jgi:hypothetical protein